MTVRITGLSYIKDLSGWPSVQASEYSLAKATYCKFHTLNPESHLPLFRSKCKKDRIAIRKSAEDLWTQYAVIQIPVKCERTSQLEIALLNYLQYIAKEKQIIACYIDKYFIHFAFCLPEMCMVARENRARWNPRCVTLMPKDLFKRKESVELAFYHNQMGGRLYINLRILLGSINEKH